jgi:predicted nucleic acid-binding protein
MVMTDAPVVVIDAGPIIHLDELGCLDLLDDFAPLITSDIVFSEVRKHRPLLSLACVPGLHMKPVNIEPSGGLTVFVDTLDLDAGETAALTLAEQEGTMLFLTDDSAARFAAESQGLRVHGTIGILLRSLRRGSRTKTEVLKLLTTIRQRSTLHLSEKLLSEVIGMVKNG